MLVDVIDDNNFVLVRNKKNKFVAKPSIFSKIIIPVNFKLLPEVKMVINTDNGIMYPIVKRLSKYIIDMDSPCKLKHINNEQMFLNLSKEHLIFILNKFLNYVVHLTNLNEIEQKQLAKIAIENIVFWFHLTTEF